MGSDPGAVSAWEQDAHVVSPAYPAQLESVRQARRFVLSVVESVGLDGCADDAGLLVSELAANAVLHARSAFTLHLRPTLEGGVRIEVEDASPLPPVHTPHSASAMSGRGLDLVACTAVRWGSHPHGTGKVVWFEVESAVSAVVPDLDTAQLLALWSDDEGPEMPPGHPSAPVRTTPGRAPSPSARGPLSGSGHASGPGTGHDGSHPPTAGIITSSLVAVEPTHEVLLRDLPVGELLGAEEAMDDLLRELQLLLLATPAVGVALADGGQHPEGAGQVVELDRPGRPARADQEAHDAGLGLAARLDAAARAFEAGRRQLREQVAAAEAGGSSTVTVLLRLPASARRSAQEYRDAVEAAAELDRTGQLLAAVEGWGTHAGVRRRYLDEVVRQLPGA